MHSKSTLLELQEHKKTNQPEPKAGNFALLLTAKAQTSMQPMIKSNNQYLTKCTLIERGEGLRGRRGTQKGVLLEGLEGEPAQEPGDAGGGILGAVVDVHGHHEERNVRHHEARH